MLVDGTYNGMKRPPAKGAFMSRFKSLRNRGGNTAEIRRCTVNTQRTVGVCRLPDLNRWFTCSYDNPLSRR